MVEHVVRLCLEFDGTGFAKVEPLDGRGIDVVDGVDGLSVALRGGQSAGGGGDVFRVGILGHIGNGIGSVAVVPAAHRLAIFGLAYETTAEPVCLTPLELKMVRSIPAESLFWLELTPERTVKYSGDS